MPVMAAVSPSHARKLLESLQTDLRALSTDCKRKYPPVKDAAERALLKIRTVAEKSDDYITGLLSHSEDIVHPFVMGCDTKSQKIVQQCLVSLQRLIAYKCVSKRASESLLKALWVLMESGIEELKLLQTTLLLITTNTVVQHNSLAKALVLSFRLHFTKDSTTINTAAAIIKQLASEVFERVVFEDSRSFDGSTLEQISLDSLKNGSSEPPKSLRPCAGDAFLLFQDLCQLVNADQPHWLVGMTEMTRTFGLELMESILTEYPAVFLKHTEFSFLLKERVCPLIIKLFSPSLKHRGVLTPPPLPSSSEKPFFPIVMRLLRIVTVITRQYYRLLVTECEIFLSLLVKFLDPEKPPWQRAMVLEVFSRICSQPELVRNICESYDMKQHSTKIFRDIVNGLGAFIQSQFIMSAATPTSSINPVKSADTQGSPPTMVGGLPVGGGTSPQSAFYYRQVWIPLTLNISSSAGSHKPIFLEMLEKIEAPLIPEGYTVSLALVCLLDIVHCVETLLDSPDQSSGGEPATTLDRALREELINSSWCGILAAFSLLLGASTDESATETLLKCQQSYASLCGSLSLATPRDAFITALCKASLPPHYALTILNPHTPQATPTRPGAYNRITNEDILHHGYQGEMIHGSHIVAVGTALPTASLPLGAQQGPVMLTAKNIQCMRALLSMAHCHGGILDSAWHQVLTTLQHLVWILGLKPSSGGSLKATQQASDNPNAVITTAVLADLPVLSSMLSRLFESSQYLNDVALHHLIDALCKLSAEAMEVAYTNREPSLFAVAKLLETGLVNLSRIQVLWKPVTGHLLEVCQHPHPGIRTWAADALMTLMKASLRYKYDPPLHQQERVQTMLLLPLQQLSAIVHADIRQRQLECVLAILHSHGDTLHHGWPLVLGVIAAVTNDQGENLIRIGFQSLQLVVTDFLPTMPVTCLHVCVRAAAKFGLQQKELNISLTAIGLLWNISDYFCQNSQRIADELVRELAEGGRLAEGGDRGAAGASPPFDLLWMCLYSQLAELCVDGRPAVRKSASQTLFSTITTHGGLLRQQTWQALLWKVLFPLLDNVKRLSSVASGSRDEGNTDNILIHHSRDTAQKQWAETQVLSLAGVARVFHANSALLQQLGDFPRAWALLLEFIEAAALCQNAEVSLAALKSFQEILLLPGDAATSSSSSSSPAAAAANGTLPDDDAVLWSTAWRVWLGVGTAVTAPPAAATALLYVPSQAFLTALVHIFPPLYAHTRARFVAADLARLGAVLQSALAVPVHADASPFILPVGDATLTPLQAAILAAIKVLHDDVLSGSDNLHTMYANIFDQLLAYVEYVVKPPQFGAVNARPVSAAKGSQADWVAMNYVPFAEAVVKLVVELYKVTANHPAVLQGRVLENIVKAFHMPLSLKYACPSQSSWLLLINSLLDLLTVGLPVARKHGAAFHGMWISLGQLLEDFLFSQQAAPPAHPLELCQRDEAIDCEIVRMMRDEMLPHSQTIPPDFTVKLMNILNRGSIHSASSNTFIDTESSRKLREEFAKSCFETLLQFSFITGEGGGGGGGSTPPQQGAITRLAVSALLRRCRDVLQKYVSDERLSGKCPLPRPRMSEMAFVLKAASTLLISLKKAPRANVDASLWSLVIELYPVLVECVTSSSTQVCYALRDVLQEYKDLLSVQQ